MALTSTWPLYAKPLPPQGRGGIRALVIGNLHDAETDYAGGWRMRTMFPDNALLTYVRATGTRSRTQEARPPPTRHRSRMALHLRPADSGAGGISTPGISPTVDMCA